MFHKESYGFNPYTVDCRFILMAPNNNFAQSASTYEQVFNDALHRMWTDTVLCFTVHFMIHIHCNVELHRVWPSWFFFFFLSLVRCHGLIRHNRTRTILQHIQFLPHGLDVTNEPISFLLSTILFSLWRKIENHHRACKTILQFRSVFVYSLNFLYSIWPLKCMGINERYLCERIREKKTSWFYTVVFSVRNDISSYFWVWLVMLFMWTMLKKENSKQNTNNGEQSSSLLHSIKKVWHLTTDSFTYRHI